MILIVNKSQGLDVKKTKLLPGQMPYDLFALRLIFCVFACELVFMLYTDGEAESS